MTSNKKDLQPSLEREDLEAQMAEFLQTLPPEETLIKPGENISVPFMCFRSNIIPKVEDIPTRYV